jgi:uncharacterized protein (TIGR03790 family)
VVIRILIVVATSLTCGLTVNAGGGPENVFLVVNSRSESSKTVANEYIALRKIPPENVLYLDWPGSLHATRGTAFRSRILMPTLAAMESRRLNAQIDYLIYSTDFPTRIDLKNLFRAEALPKGYDGVASLTGATFLAPYIVARNPAVAAFTTNWYMPGAVGQNLNLCQDVSNVPSRGFRAVYLWDQETNRTSDAKVGQRYLLSTMLGVTYGRGNTVEEIVSYLTRAVQADGKRPTGTIYYVANNNKRSVPRHACFDAVSAEINQLGVRSVVQQGTIPHGAKDVMGLMAGVAAFDWPASGSTILPGAICDHFTSYGGDLRPESSQTPLTEFLRYGAAGASGTVKEPHTIQAKFPLPTLHLHYVRGCSLAESFYQSVRGPYQLLIVGEPLCQPWAQFPTVTVNGVKANQEVRGTLSVTPSGATGGPAVRVIDFFVDGRLAARAAPGNVLNLDTTKLSDGYHELRFVGAAAGAIETQGRVIVPIMVNNHGVKLDVTLGTNAAVDATATIRLNVRQQGAEAIAVRQNSREVGRVKGEAGEIEIAAATLGRGPVVLQAFSEGTSPVASLPLRIAIE